MRHADHSSFSADVGVAAWEAVLRTRAGLVPVIAAEVEEATGLSLSWYDVLLELSRAAEPIRMQQLGSRVVLSRSRVSRIVDRMEGEGLVSREQDPEDGRATLVSLSASGRGALRRTAPVYLEAIGRHFSNILPAEDLATIAAALQQVLTAHEEAPPEP